MLGALDGDAQGDDSERRIDALPGASSDDEQQERGGEEGEEVGNVMYGTTVTSSRAPGLQRDDYEAADPDSRDSG